jgi:hypothetical protein
MMNFQIKLRQQVEYCDPVGPSFDSAKKFKFSIEGTEIEFRAPKHRPMIKSEKAKYLKAFYKYDDHSMSFKSQNKEVVVKDHWEYANLFHHDWAFNGPWFTGCLADVSMSILIYRSKLSNNDISFFHPRAFEQIIGDFLTNKYSKMKTDGKYDYQAPINWQPIDSLPVPAARLEVVSDGSVALYSKSVQFFFPIDNHHFICMIFYPSRSAPGNEAEIDKIIGYKNLGELIDNIIGSVKVTLSPEAKMQQENAIKGLEDTKLTRVFLPMQWKKSKSKKVADEKKSLGNSSQE